MECPKCGAEIGKNDLVCPNCKKVLKIVCPVCRYINTKNICKKCGEVLITKCSNCGKINLNKNKKCVKCGYSTEKSAVQEESNTDTFVVVKLEFPNADLIKAVFGANQVYTKFMSNLDNMICSCVRKAGVRRQIIKNYTYIIRFNKSYTFSSSAKLAMTTVQELVSLITKMNVKLLDKKKISLKCNFSIMSRNADDEPYDVDTGYKVNMVTQGHESLEQAIDAFQIITNDEFYDVYHNDYKMESLDAVLVKGKMTRFYEINIKDTINIENYIQEALQSKKVKEIEVPEYIKENLISQEENWNRKTAEELEAAAGEDLYNMELIDFDEVNSAFYTTESVNVLENVTRVLQDVPRGILAIKGAVMYQPYTLKMLAAIDELGIYQNIIPITCSDDMKYSPYSFFKELISSIFEYATAQKLFDQNDFSIFATVDSKNLIKDLITCKQRDMNDAVDIRMEYFTVFSSLLQSIPNSVIYIENFDKIDAGSRYVLDLLFDNFDEMDVSYILSYDKSFSLHKRAHFLLSRPYYTEIAVVPSTFQSIVKSNEDFYKEIIDDYYFQRVAKYTAGSVLFLDYAIQYLVESGVYTYTKDSVRVINPITIVIPSNLEQLIQRRLNLLKDSDGVLKFLALCVFLGTRVDLKSVEIFGIKNWQEYYGILAQEGFLYLFDDCIYFPNYALLRENLVKVLSEEEMKAIAYTLLEYAYTEIMPSPAKAYLYEVVGENQKVILEWEKLANLNLSMGDFTAYLNCSIKILEFLEKNKQDWSEEELEQYKTSIYQNISNNMFEFNPEETKEIADKTLDDFQKQHDNENYSKLCAKMISGSVVHGEYRYALSLTHKYFYAMSEYSFNPLSRNFSVELLAISLNHIKILFGIGALSDCIDVGYNILNVLDSAKLESITYNDNVSKEEIEALILECIVYMALSDIFTFRENVNDLLAIVNRLFTFIPKEYFIFVQLQNFIKGDDINISGANDSNNIYSRMIYHILYSFENYYHEPVAFAKEIYKVKIIAKDSYVPVFEYFADLLIGYAYLVLKSYDKSDNILSKVLENAKNNGLNTIMYIAFYVLSILNLRTGKFDIAYGLLNNSSIQMEKAGGVSDYLSLLNKINMYKYQVIVQDNAKAQICMNQIKHIVNKYKLKYDLNIDIEPFISENQTKQG